MLRTQSAKRGTQLRMGNGDFTDLRAQALSHQTPPEYWLSGRPRTHFCLPGSHCKSLQAGTVPAITILNWSPGMFVHYLKENKDTWRILVRSVLAGSTAESLTELGGEPSCRSLNLPEIAVLSLQLRTPSLPRSPRKLRLLVGGDKPGLQRMRSPAPALAPEQSVLDPDAAVQNKPETARVLCVHHLLKDAALIVK